MSFIPRVPLGLFLSLIVSAGVALCAPIALELTGGSVIKGDLVSWNGQQAVVKAEFGSLTFKREQLSQATIQRLDLLSGDPQKLAAEWFPGGKPTSTEAERLFHMSAAKDVLLDLHADILCLQEVRDWDSVAEPVSILPGLQPLVVSRFREMGSSNPANRYRFALAG
jgi:hypothetical protein